MHHEKLAVLALAIENEKQGRDFYAEAARCSPDEQGRQTNHDGEGKGRPQDATAQYQIT